MYLWLIGGPRAAARALSSGAHVRRGEPPPRWRAACGGPSSPWRGCSPCSCSCAVCRPPRRCSERSPPSRGARGACCASCRWRARFSASPAPPARRGARRAGRRQRAGRGAGTFGIDGGNRMARHEPRPRHRRHRRRGAPGAVRGAAARRAVARRTICAVARPARRRAIGALAGDLPRPRRRRLARGLRGARALAGRPRRRHDPRGGAVDPRPGVERRARRDQGGAPRPDETLPPRPRRVPTTSRRSSIRRSRSFSASEPRASGGAPQAAAPGPIPAARLRESARPRHLCAAWRSEA